MADMPGDLTPVPPDLFAGPVKRSVTIAGHPTSISLEPVFWAALRDAAHHLELPVSALIAQIDALRIGQPAPPNLGSAIRVWLFARSASDNSSQ